MSGDNEALRLADWAASYNMNMHNRAAAELRRLQAVNKELLKALQQAEAHLEYTGWGDSWERECAREAKLPEQIRAAIAKAEGQA